MKFLTMPFQWGTYAKSGYNVPTPPPSPDAYPTQFDYYISPTGSNSNNGLTTATPWRTFAKAFSTMPAGKRLGLMDGVYGTSTGTGMLEFQATGSAIPLSGNALAFTEVCSVNLGGATIVSTGGYDGNAVFIGRSSLKTSYIKLRGFKVIGGFSFYNTDHCYAKQIACNGSFGTGTIDQSGGATLTNNYNLFEDCWIWGYGIRGLCQNYQSHDCVWRRVVLRVDGGGPSGGGNPNIGITVYNSQRVYMQNVICIDRVITGAEPYGDFATAQHDSTAPDEANFYFGGNVWNGCISINSQDEAFHGEADNLQSGYVSWTLKDCAAVPGGINYSPGSGNASTLASVAIDGLTLLGGQMRVRNLAQASSIKNVVVANSPNFDVNVSTAGSGTVTVDSIDYYNNPSGNNFSPITNPKTYNPLSGSPASIKYPLRVESGSLGKGTGNGGADIGATIAYRIGVDGTFRGESGFNDTTGVPLWPWPNEARIKADMSAAYTNVSSGVATRGFCTTGNQLDGVTPVTLTSYIWEFLGNQMPSGIY